MRSEDYDSYFSMENGNHSSTLIVQTLLGRDMYMRKSSATSSPGLLYLPYQYLSAVNVSISYQSKRFGLPARWREGEGREGRGRGANPGE